MLILQIFFLALLTNNIILADEPCFIPGDNSPITAQNGTRAVAFSPIINNKLFHAHIANNTASVSVESINTQTGLLTAVSGSPFTTSTGGFNVAFSPTINNSLFAAMTNYVVNKITVFTVDTTTGIFTPVAGSPFTSGSGPKTIAFTPVINGSLMAIVLNSNDNTISTYQVNITTGAFSLLHTSSPTPNNLFNLALSPLTNNKIYVAAVNSIQNSIYLYTLDMSTGALTAASGSPFSVAGTDLRYISFSPVFNNRVYALVANNNTLQLFLLNADTDSLSLVQTIDTGITLSVAFSSVVNDSLFAASSSINAQVHVYSVSKANGNLNELLDSPIAVTAYPQDTRFSPAINNAFFLSVASDAGAISLYKIALPPYLANIQNSNCSSFVTATGISFPNAILDIYADQMAIGTGTSDSQGNFSISSITPLARGTYNISVKISQVNRPRISCGTTSNSIPITITSCPTPNPDPIPTPDPIKPTSEAQTSMTLSSLTSMMREKYGA